MDFDPFDVSTWKATESLDNPETKAALAERIQTIISESGYWHQMNDLCRVLEGYPVTPSYEKLRKTNRSFFDLSEWLLSSDGRRERAATQLRAYLRLKRCPSCGDFIDETELEAPPPFNWDEFEP